MAVFGTSAADFLTDTIGGGNEFYGHQGNDTIDAGDGNDTLYGGDGADSLIGGLGDDDLWGDWFNISGSLPGNDFLDGGDGSDTIYAGFGADIVLGGAGNDTIYGDFAPDTVGAAGNDSIDGGEGDDFIDGEEGNDTLLGGTGADELRGNSGNDWLAGGDGNDTLYGDFPGAAGNDTLDGGAGADFLRGGSGDDTYLISDLNDDIFDSGGNDTAIVSVSGFKLPAGIENVQYVNGAVALGHHIDALYSGDRWGLFGEPVTLTYGFLSEATAGAFSNGSGSFQAMGSAEKDRVRQAIADWAAVSGITFIEDSNPITVATAASVNLRFGMNIQPGSAGYAFYPTQGDIYIDYTDGLFLSVVSHEIGHALGLKHPFEDGAVLSGGEDSDQYTVMSYTSRPDTLFLDVIDLGGGDYDFNYSFISPDTPQLYDIAAIQYLYGGNMATGAGDNSYAFSPSDVPFFRALWDSGGIDTIDISAFATGGVIDLRDGYFSSIPVLPDAIPEGWTATEPTYLGIDNLAISYGAIIENATGGSGNDALTGNDYGNVLDGGAGADTLAGGAGDDLYMVDNAGDLTLEVAASGQDTVRSTVSYTLAGDVETLILGGTDDLSGGGNTLGNILSGNSGNNILDGAGGADIIAGGPGNDTYIIDNGGDLVMELGNSGIDAVQSSVNYDLMQAWHVENLTLTGGGAINGSGNWLDNLITGNGLANVLIGNRGDDVLAGGDGNDTLTGGPGSDIFYFDASGAPNADLILDFQGGIDHIHLSLSAFTALGGTGTVVSQSVQSALESQISNVSGNAGDSFQDYLKYATDTGHLYYDADGTGAGGLSLVATIYSGGTTPASLGFAPIDDIAIV